FYVRCPPTTQSSTLCLHDALPIFDAEATGPGREGAALREAAYGLASPALAAALGPDALLAVRDTLARWVRLADAAFGELGLEGVSAAIAEGRARLDDARARLDEGDDVAAADAIRRAEIGR